MTITENTNQRFMTYLAFKEKPRGNIVIPQPVVDSFLQKIMERLVTLKPQYNEEEWARYFLKALLQANLLYQMLWWTDDRALKMLIYSTYLKTCENFLFCYFQPTCLQVAKTLNQRLRQSPNSALHYPVEECYLIASELTLRPATLVKRFDFTANVPLQAYARSAIQQAVRNRIAKELNAKAIKFSGLGYLKNVSLSRLKRDLRNYGLSSANIEKYCLVATICKGLWEELKPSSQGNGRQRYQLKLESLEEKKLALIADNYQRQAQRLGWENTTVTPAEVKQVLLTCIQVIQSNDQPRSQSWEEVKEGSSVGISADLNPLDTAIQEEEKTDLLEIRTQVKKTLESLEPVAYKALLLSLGLQIHQSDLTAFLGLKKQYQVARKFQRYQRDILRKLIQSYQSKTRMEKEASMVLKEYLTVYSQQFFSQLLATAIEQHLTPLEKEKISQSLTKIRETNLITDETETLTTKIKQLFATEIEKHLQLEISQFQSAPQKIELFIETWLQNNQAQLK